MKTRVIWYEGDYYRPGYANLRQADICVKDAREALQRDPQPSVCVVCSEQDTLDKVRTQLFDRGNGYFNSWRISAEPLPEAPDTWFQYLVLNTNETQPSFDRYDII